MRAAEAEVTGADLERARVAVLSGGPSSEREVSLATGRAVVAALSEGGLPGAVVDVRIEPDRSWRLGGERLSAHRALRRLEEVDVFFLGLHGRAGEDGTVQGFLETADRRYTGSGVRASALCMDKHALRLLARDAGFAVSPAVVVTGRGWRGDRARSLARIHGAVGERCVVKPRCGGSSVATALIAARDEVLAPAIEAALAEDDDALVEGFVAGVEVSVGVLGNADGALRALPPVEIRPAAGRFFDYQQKYDPDGAEELCPAESLTGAEQTRLTELALRAHRLAGCDGYSRVDFIVPRAPGPASGSGGAAPDIDPVLLEVNTLPGLTPRSLLPQEAAAVGLDYRSLCLELVLLALRKGREPSRHPLDGSSPGFP